MPSLLAARASPSDARDAARILASLEGRVPEAEARHMPPKRRSKAQLLVLLLLIGGVAAAFLWAVYDTQDPPVVVAQADSGSASSELHEPPPPAAAMAPAPESPSAIAAPPAAMPSSAASHEADPPASSAAIIEDHPLAQLTQPDAQADAREPSNPLSALAVTAAAPKPAAVAAPRPAAASASHSPVAQAPGPTVQRARESAASADAAPKTAQARGKAAPRNDGDAALLAALMSYGLPPASPPGTKVYKSDGIFVRELPGSPLAARLDACRKLSFLESEQCRLRVCAGHWGTAPECPNAQAHIEP